MSVLKLKKQSKPVKIYFKIIEDRLVSLNATYIDGVHEGYVEINTKDLKEDAKTLLSKVGKKK